MRFYTESERRAEDFANKVWNVSRFILMNIENENLKKQEESALTLAEDKWILSSVNTLAKDVTENMDKFEFGDRSTESL